MNELTIKARESPEPYDLGWEFRLLFAAICEYQGAAIFAELLEPWLLQHGAAALWLRELAGRAGDPIPLATTEELYALYAVNRVNERLLLSFQPSGVDCRFAPVRIDLNDYLLFMRSLGFEARTPADFSPLEHEIVEVTQAEDEREDLQILGTFWPCLMLGPMIFCRSGVHIRVGRDRIDRDVATSSKLYWAYCRRHRPCEDLSYLGDPQDQWRTAFRRDYRFGRHVYFNVDAKLDYIQVEQPESDPDPLTQGGRLELVMYRCFLSPSDGIGDHDVQGEWVYSYSVRFQEMRNWGQ